MKISDWWRRDRNGATAPRPALRLFHIPPRLLILTLICLGGAGITGLHSRKNTRDAEAMRAHGREATAAISGVHGKESKDHKISYTVDLLWRDASGVERFFGSAHISNAYAQQIAPGGLIVTRQTNILYLEEDRSARPIILADADERTKQDSLGREQMVGLAIVSLIFAALTIWWTLRARRREAA